MPVQQRYTSIDNYIATFPEEVAKRLQAIREVVATEIPDVEETISYHMPTFRHAGSSVEFVAAWKKHISIYPISDLMESSIPQLSEYRTSGKGTIQLPLNRPLPLDLIRNIVRFHMWEAQDEMGQSS
jgi:uncharacterized protein YdhG (YjbR/CyaY superfamily)